MTEQVLILTGPTASGKSHLALHLSTLFDSVIINADSMQVYKDLPILSAQPPLDDQSISQHHLYGFLDATESFDASRWADLANKAIIAAFEFHKTPIIVGGTGLYLKALLEGFSPIPPIPESIREDLAHQFDQADPYPTLQKLDPEMANTLKPKDRQRIMRALEVKIHTGVSLKKWQSAPAVKHLQYPHETIFLNPSKEILEANIQSRLSKMMRRGAIEEVESLMNLGLEEKSMIFKTLGYPEIKGYLLGSSSQNEMIEKIHIKTRQYAKRQRTWLRHQLKADVLLEEIPEDVGSLFDAYG